MCTNSKCKANILFGLLLCVTVLHGQDHPGRFWEIPDSLHNKRYQTALITGATTYTGALVTLNSLWYKKYPRTSFHFFDDSREWMQMDKAGHLFTAYFEADWSYGIARWTGMKKSAAIRTGMLTGTLLQATVEVLDGFSPEWGFSWYDFGCNIAGVSLWGVQQSIWDEQRIRVKFSTTKLKYSSDIITGIRGTTSTLRDRADALYGKNLAQTFLKDYNAQTIWLSVNLHSFLKEESKFPKWLNLAIGYGAENMYGGFENRWESNGDIFQLSSVEYPRYRQLYISPDIDLSKIKTQSPLLRTLLRMANIFKIPMPSVKMRL